MWADVAPAAVERAFPEGHGLGQFLVYFDSPAGSVGGPEIAVLEGGVAFEDFGFAAADDAAFGDSEVMARESEMEIAGVADGRDVAGTCQAVLTPYNSPRVAILRAGREAPGLGDVDADVIDQAFGDRGIHSCGLLKSSPMESAVVHCWRI